MRRADGADRLDGRRVVEQHAAAAVHLRVDEAGQQQLAAEVVRARRRVPRGSSVRARRRRCEPPSTSTAQTARRGRALVQDAPVDQRQRASERLGDLAQVRRAVGIVAARERERVRQAVEALHQQQRLDRADAPRRSAAPWHRAPARRPAALRAARHEVARQRRDAARASRRPASSSAGKPARTSAIGPCRTSAALNASACRPQVSLNLSAASCAMPSPRPRADHVQVARRGAESRALRSSRAPRPLAAVAARPAGRPRARRRRVQPATRCTTAAREAMKDLVAATLRSSPAQRAECCSSASRASGESLVVHQRDDAARRALRARAGGREQVRARARLRDREHETALRGPACVDRPNSPTARRRRSARRGASRSDSWRRWRRGRSCRARR